MQIVDRAASPARSTGWKVAAACCAGLAARRPGRKGAARDLVAHGAASYLILIGLVMARLVAFRLARYQGPARRLRISPRGLSRCPIGLVVDDALREPSCRARVIPREVSEGLLPVALLRPHLGSLPLERPHLGFLLLRPFCRLGKREQHFYSESRSCDPP